MKITNKTFLFLSLLATPLFAQELTSDLSGTVVDASGSAVSGAQVTITYQPTNSVVRKDRKSVV